MTTKNSPLHELKAQADRIAKLVKAMGRGEVPSGGVGNVDKILDAMSKPGIKFGVAMDDKIITIEMSWQKIRETDEAGIAEWILNQMREAQETKQ